MAGIVESLACIHEELKVYVNKNTNELKSGLTNNNNDNIDTSTLSIPSEKWTVLNSFNIMTSYPRGISKAVLLTELEARYKKSLKRGEHGGRLSQCVATKELSLTDILEGKLTKLDEFRCNFVSEDASVDMILHRQHTDFLAFVKYYYKGVDQTNFISNRKCRLTGGKMLLDKSSIILPTPLLAFFLSTSSQSDKNFVNDILYQHHNELASILHDLSLLWYETLPLKGNGIDYAPEDCCPIMKAPINDKLNEITMFNNKAIGCFARISMISKVFDHPYTNLSVFRYVKLSIISDSPKRPCYVYLILLDDQVNLANLLNINDTYYVYRPYIALNTDESLFKSGEAGHHTVLQYNIVYRDTIPLNVLEDGCYPCPCNFLYGATTTIINIDNNGSLPFLSFTNNVDIYKSDVTADSQSQTKLPDILYIHVLTIETVLDTSSVKKNKRILWGVINSCGLNAVCKIYLSDDHQRKNILKGQLLAIALSDLYRVSLKLSSIPANLMTMIPNNDINEQHNMITGLLQGPFMLNLSRILAFSQSPSIMLPQSFNNNYGTFFVLAKPRSLLSPLFRDSITNVEMKDDNGNGADCLFSNLQSKNLSSKCFISDKIEFVDGTVFALLVTYTGKSFFVECISDVNEIALNINMKRPRIT